MSIGATLAAARRRAGLTLSEVSRRTRVRESIVSGIENDDYTACGGDFYARGHIRSIAKVVGIDSAPLIEEYDTARGLLFGVFPTDVREDDEAQSVARVAAPGGRRVNVSAVLGLAVVVVLAFLGYQLVTGSRRTAAAAPAASTHVAGHPSARRHAGASGHGKDAASAPPRPASQPPRPPAQTLIPASASAFGANGSGGGDNPQLAGLAIDHSPGTAWHTDWYASPQFGNLYSGTGLLLDLGRTASIVGARVDLGPVSGAAFQWRIGSAPSLGALRPVARATHAGGVVRLRLASPVSGRYLLLWFTRLPTGPAGTFEASVYDVTVRVQA